MNHEPLSNRMIRGSIVLIGLLLFTAFIPRLYYYFYPSEPIAVVRQAKEYDSTYRKQSSFDLDFNNKKEKKSSKFKRPPSKFDPNKYTVSDWMHIGLSEKQAEAIIKYNKFGIYNEESLRKIKMINEECFLLIKDSVIYPVLPEREYGSFSKKDVVAIKLLELNAATKEELMEIKGIKDFISTKIINYRTALGGFVNKKQLLEVYGVTQENFDRFKELIVIDATKIKKININLCTTEELAKHPYITRNVANSIVKMRAKWENYSNFGQLLESELIDQELLNKIQPYLTL